MKRANRFEDTGENQAFRDPENALRPQSVIFTLLAEHMLDRNLPVFAGSFIAVLERLGIGEHATRAALARMTRRGLLHKHRAGRNTYFSMTKRLVEILDDGRQRIWVTGVVDTRSRGAWTVLTFSLPEAWQRKRYDLRARLSWAGFGMLQNGVWLAPREVDVTPLLAELALTSYVRVFHGRAAAPTDPGEVIGAAFGIDALAARYRGFVDRWQEGGRARAPDPLTMTLRLSTEWLHVIRHDPRIPVHLLPNDWPAIEAQKLFRHLHKQNQAAARRLARHALATLT